MNNSPKPPPQRVTFTLPVMVHAKVCMFIVTGKSKASIVKEIIEKNAQVPANIVAPQAGKLIWMIDADAASQVSPELKY